MSISSILIHAVPLDRTRIFVTTPRFSTGIPASLGFVSPRQGDLLIQPYPDYSWHSSHGANCDGITSVVRIAIDACNQLWVLDSGSISRTIVCPPQLLVFNLVNDMLVRRYRFPPTQYTATSIFITPVRLLNNWNEAKFWILVADSWYEKSFSIPVMRQHESLHRRCDWFCASRLWLAHQQIVEDPKPFGKRIWILNIPEFMLKKFPVQRHASL